MIGIAPFIGSFLSVVVTRLPNQKSIVQGRSACPKCGHALAVLDLIPILSWLFLRGRCRYCDRTITPLYPGLELSASALAIWASLVVAGWVFAVTCVLGWSLLALAEIDRRHYILPDSITQSLVPFGILVAWQISPDNLLPHVIGAAVGFVTFIVVGRLYKSLRGRDGLGFGDAKLLAAAGAWVSWIGLPSVLLWACATAIGFSLIRTYWQGRAALKQRIAFGPHLCLGIWLVWLYGPLLSS